MTERELGNFSKWPLQELMEKERSFPNGHLMGNEIRAEINRRRTETDQRRAGWDHRFTLISLIIAGTSAFAGVVYGLDRGIYVGSSSYILPAGSFGKEEYVVKECRYLFVTGFSKKPAHGGELDFVPTMGGRQPVNNAGQLYCRLFGE